ncbi:MAG: efflux RND transporter periplasmic adaptor subunit [Kofleriaceae bacterium]|nr:efflux RND transporter periplasmic adaptor subunit [Kofleriaceae bacterium]
MSAHTFTKIRLGIALALASACARRSEATVEHDSRRQVPIAVPRTEDVVVERAYVASVRAARHAELRARFKGVIESVVVDEGERVRAGQVLFTIAASARAQEAASARAAQLGAEAELRAAEQELENTKLLVEKQIVSEAELRRGLAKVDLQKARVEEAKAAVGRTKVELGRAQIRAPFDGVVDLIRHKTGAMIEDDALLTTVSDPREVVAYFAISEREYLEYARESERQTPVVQLALADGTMFPHEGAIDAVGGEIDTATGTLVYRARFPNPQGTLKHGSSGKVVLKTKVRGAVLVPQRSTFETQGNIYAYVVDTGNIARIRKLDVKHAHGDAFVIGGGLAPGERFVLEGIQQLKDGAAVEPLAPTTPAKLSAKG